MTSFEKWLRKICIYQPSHDARDLAQSAWTEAYKKGVKDGIDASIDRVEFIKSASPSELRH